MKKLKMHSDGASRGNPGNAAIGVIIASEEGEVIKEISEYLGTATNNEAEYKALIAGIKAVKELFGSTDWELVCYADSELLVRQVNGIYKVQNERLKVLHSEIINMIKGHKVKFIHVLRKFNKRADELANMAIDRIHTVSGAG